MEGSWLSVAAWQRKEDEPEQEEQNNSSEASIAQRLSDDLACEAVVVQQKHGLRENHNKLTSAGRHKMDGQKSKKRKDKTESQKDAISRISTPTRIDLMDSDG
ncbi:unnamed protein product [Pleuronectes platessa]|uniref:Uncharacterized protein n=1 Tax=Pleuronectes platessa TaxID=8262 RepID=A0A9N7TN05_PLEPL|nr:unnamed protein product [Pleuronectes platessa]